MMTVLFQAGVSIKFYVCYVYKLLEVNISQKKITLELERSLLI